MLKNTTLSVSGLMNEYFSSVNSNILKENFSTQQTPIKPKKSNWTITSGSESLLRSFEFKNSVLLRQFVNDLMILQEELSHYAQILIDENIVKVRVRTRTLEKVTEIDIEFAAQLDNIYEDMHVESKFESAPQY